MALTQAQFSAHQDKIDAAMRATKRGTAERAAVEAVSKVWEAAIALPQRTFADRQARLAAIEEASKVSL
jgi:hypothetical protein